MMNKRKIATKKIFASVLCLTAAAALTGQQGATKDPDQRSAEIYQMKTSAAEGPQRGEELYYYKCWYCHNKYAKTGPALKDIFKRDKLRSGQPVSDAAVIEKIRQGGQLMPAYRYTLRDADLTDLVSYFKNDKCCFEGDEPPPNPRYRGITAAAAPNAPARRTLRGGARGTVRGAKGELLEGIMVQMISTKTAIRTTVYTDVEGRYEFPVLEAGTYTLRIARPLEFKPYVKAAVRIDGATPLDDIVLQRVTDKEVLPPTPDILAQLT